MRQQLCKLSLSHKDLFPASRLSESWSRLQWLEQPQESGTPLLFQLSFRDALRTIPQESLVTRGTWGRLCPCSIRGVTAKRVSWGWFFQGKASLLSVKWKISPAPPLLVLGVLGSVGALHLSSMNGIPRPYFPSLLRLSPSLRDPPVPG